jgi:threonine dehydrogenase-like Zn-dependent dehydrogenase
MMKAVVLRGPGNLAVEEVPMPPVGQGQVLLRVRACGICGSDLRYLAGENPWAQHTLGLRLPNPPRMILGHEVAGEIAQVGDGVPGARVGERVVALAFKGCGRCEYCASGQPNLCAETQHLGHGAGWAGLEYNPGGMAEFCPLWAEMAYRLPDHVSFEEATLLDGAGVAVHAVNRASLDRGDAIAVIGCGAIGLLILQVARALHEARVLAVDVEPKPLQLAAALGAQSTLDATAGDPVAASAEFTEGRGPATVFNTVGDRESVAAGMRMLRRGGIQVLLAVGTESLDLPATALSGERILTTSANNTYEEFECALRLLGEGRLNARPLVTHVLPLSEALRGFEIAEHKANYGAIKVVLMP